MAATTAATPVRPTESADGRGLYSAGMLRFLHGVRVVDLTTIVLGPYATALLADLGADVIKVEPPGGDLYRAGPPARSAGMGAPFMTINHNKRSIVLDLTVPQSSDVLGALVDTADVVIHNMLPRVATKLGVDAATLTRDRPHLIHVTTPGFGSGGPDAGAPAYDDVIQGRMGLASLLAGDDGEPRLAPTTLADKITGLHATVAVLAALAHRHRTGEGAVVEVPMFETMASFVLAEHMGGRAFEPALGPPGYNRLLNPYRRPHRTADGYIVLLPYSDRHWQALLDLIDDPAWKEETWVYDRSQRAERIDELYALLGTVMGSRTTDEWLTLLKAADVPAGPVSSLEDLFTDPHLTAVGFFERLDHPSEGTLVRPRTPFRASPPEDPDRPASRAGADTRDVLTELGYTTEEIDRFVDVGAVVAD